MFGDEDQMHMVRRQHPVPHCDPVRDAVQAKQIAIGGVVFVGEERLLPAIAALGPVMRRAGQDEAGEAGQGIALSHRGLCVNYMHCHRNPDTWCGR